MSIFIFIVILVVLILVHEFGHFIVAKRAGIRVDEFSIGFGPTLISKQYGETRYVFKLLLLGGYVKIFGENPNTDSISGPESARSFVNQSKIVQTAVIVAGVFFNILLAWIIFIGVFMIGVPTAISDNEIHTVQNPRLIIVDVLDNTPAKVATLASGDTILGIKSDNGDTLPLLTGIAVTEFISTHGGQSLTFSYTRGAETLSATIVPEENIVPDKPEQAAIGISMGLIGDKQFAPHVAVWEGTLFTIKMIGAISVALFGFFANIFMLNADLSQVAGPVGIITLVGDAAESGIISLFLFTAFISLNLAIINILPFPALDGGRFIIILIEAIKGSPIKPIIVNAVNTLGFVLLILLMIFVTYNDVIRIFSE